MIKIFLKKLLNLIPRETVVPMFGSNFGNKWVIGSANYRNWLSLDEKAVQKAFKENVKRGDIVFDIGANVGFYTLLASSLGAKVYAFEPSPRNYNYLLKHIEINKVNAEAIQVALSDASGEFNFDQGENYSVGHLSSSGTLKVRAMKADDFIAEHKAPNLIKLDVEGHELQVLKGMEKTLREGNVTIIMEGDKGETEIIGFLEKLGYAVKALDENNIIAKKIN